MTPRARLIAAGSSLALVALVIAGAAHAKDPEKKKPKRAVPDPKPTGACPKGMRWSGTLKKCIVYPCPDGFDRNDDGVCFKKDDPGVVFCPEGFVFDDDSGTCEPFGDDDKCPSGFVRNAARLRLFGSGLKGEDLQVELAKYPLCVPETCPSGTTRNEYGECVIEDDPDPEPKGPGSHRACPPGRIWDEATESCVDDPSINDPIDIDDIIKDYPEGNAFYQIKKGDIIGWGLSGMHDEAITQNMLGRELFLAARDHLGMSAEDAMKWSRDRRKNPSLTNKIYNAILCCAMNDACYGTWGYCGDVAIAKGRCPKSMRNHPGEHGRAIRPLTQHADNAFRLRQGMNMARVVAILSSNEKGNGLGNPVAPAVPGGDNTYPLLWMPGVDRKALADSNGTVLNFLSTQANPPGWITANGIDDFSGSMLTTYGCGAGAVKFE